MYWTGSLSSTDSTGLLYEGGKLGQWLNTDLVMLGPSGVEMITWQTHQAVEKLAMVQERKPFLSFLLLENTRGPPAARRELFIPMETKEMGS